MNQSKNFPFDQFLFDKMLDDILKGSPAEIIKFMSIFYEKGLAESFILTGTTELLKFDISVLDSLFQPLLEFASKLEKSPQISLHSAFLTSILDIFRSNLEIFPLEDEKTVLVSVYLRLLVDSKADLNAKTKKKILNLVESYKETVDFASVSPQNMVKIVSAMLDSQTKSASFSETVEKELKGKLSELNKENLREYCYYASLIRYSKTFAFIGMVKIIDTYQELPLEVLVEAVNCLEFSKVRENMVFTKIEPYLKIKSNSLSDRQKCILIRIYSQKFIRSSFSKYLDSKLTNTALLDTESKIYLLSAKNELNQAEIETLQSIPENDLQSLSHITFEILLELVIKAKITMDVRLIQERVRYLTKEGCRNVFKILESAKMNTNQLRKDLQKRQNLLNRLN